MRTQLTKWESVAAILIGLAVLLFAYVNNPTTEPRIADTKQAQNNVGRPTILKIPSLNLEAPIEHVAKAADGSMDVPKLPFNVAWYELGSRPGEIGSAVIAGHVNWKDETKAIFSDLHNLKPGDRITIEDDQKIMVTFVVQRSEIYNADADATDIFISSDGKARLNLITCSGEWNKQTDTYSQRLVVFAEILE